MSKLAIVAAILPAAGQRLDLHRQACPERSTAHDTHGAYTVELTDISHWE
jgi:hypothetical protein